MLLATSALAGCGGNDDDEDTAVPPTTPPVTEPGKPAAEKVLFIGVDGLTYDAMRRGVADKSLPNIAQLTITRAWTGGVTGDVTQQPTLAAPGWATLLTGQWADAHGVRSNAADQAMKSPSLFQRVKTAHPEARIAGAFNSALLAGLVGRDRDAGYLQALTDCAGVDDCVATQARDRITEGYDVVVAQFGAPERAASDSGFGANYQAVISQTDAAVGVLAKQIADRRAANPGENWLIVVAASHGLGKTGVGDGLPLSANKTIMLATNQPMLGGTSDDASFDGVWDNNWYALPSAADVTPTMLAHMGALPAAGQYDMAGTALSESLALRRVAARTSMDNKTVTLTWVRVGEPEGDIVVSRDGAEVARLPGTATEYADTGYAFDTEGVHNLNYTVSAGDAVSAARATVVYVKPVPLLASLRTGLTMLFPFEGNVTDVAAGGGMITPYDGVQVPAYATAGIFGKMFQNERGSAALGAFKLDYPAGLLDTLQAFTIGFWYQSDGTANDRSILGNKDYYSGGNPGITISQWAGPELRFNLAGGGTRVDINGARFTPNKPVYIAMTIDKTAKTMTAYVYDKDIGYSRRSVGTGLVNLAQVAGLFGPHIGLNEDGLGTYGICCAGTRGPYTMNFDDLAFWSRALTEDEVKSLAMSGKSVSELFP